MKSWITGLTLIGAAYVWGLWSPSVPFTGDQKVYLSTAMEMRELGVWLQPHLFGEPSYYKPPFQYWMTLLGWNVFGYGLLGAFIPSAIALLGCCLFLTKIENIFEPSHNDGSAALLFATTIGALSFTPVAQMEIWLCFFYLGSTFAMVRGFETDPKWRWIYLAWIMAGVSAWVKSPLYSVLWAGTFVIYVAMQERRLQMIKSPHFWISVVLGAGVGASWYLYILDLDGPRFLADYVYRENLAKNSGNEGSIPMLWGALLYYLFPWTFLCLGFFKGFAKEKVAPLFWAWFIPVGAFFTIYPYRIKPYLFLLVPLFSLALALQYRKISAYFYKITAILVLLVAIVAGFLLFRFELFEGDLGRIIVASVWIAGAVASGFVWSKNMRGAALAVLYLFLVIRLGSVQIGNQDYRGLKDKIEASNPTCIAYFDPSKGIWHDIGLVSTTIGKPIERELAWEGFMDRVWDGCLGIVDDQVDLSSLKGGSQSRELEITPWLRLRSKLKLPWRDFISYGRTQMPDWQEVTQRKFHLIRTY